MELTLDEALIEGVEAHKAGQIEEADRLYTAILKVQPNHPDANHNMGVLAVSAGKLKEALPFFQAALKANPSIGQFWLSYIDALIKLDRIADAKSVFDQAKGRKTKGGTFDQLEEWFFNKSINEIQPQDPPSGKLQIIIDLYAQGELKQALFHTTKMLESFPNSVVLCNIAGAANAGLMQYDDAINSYKKALKINPDYADAYNNMGAALNEKGDLEAAIATYKKALKIKPDSADAYYNMGIALNNKGDLESAIDSYKKALGVRPEYADAYYNMGIAFNGMGDLEAAIESYNKALKIKPNYAEAISNLLKLLTSHTPEKESQNPIVKVNEAIRKLDIKNSASTIISDDQVVDLVSKSSDYITSHCLEFRTEESQIFRRNSVDLNCKRHKLIFNKHNIIPEFCFGCYKVQIEPRSIIELIKLFLVFNQLELNENNTRKCMIELRPEVSGSYKGLIYCSGLKQANQIADYLDIVVKESIGLGLPSKVKRGCSEYPTSFPNYEQINNSGPQLMNYNKDWKVIEKDHDRKNYIFAKTIIRPSLSGLNFNDVLIIQKWIDYARGIGDPSVELISQGSVRYQDIYDLAKARLNMSHPSD